LEETIVNEQQELLEDISFFVWRFGVAERESVAVRAREVLHDAVVTALEKVDRYDPTRRAYLWLRGIAIKKVLELRDSQRSRQGCLTLVGDTSITRHIVGHGNATELSETDMFDLLYRPDTDPASAQAVDEILSLAGEDDREIIRLHYIEGLDGKELAAKFSTSEGAIYQRLCRARIRMRREYSKDQH
jgi:RNA polymerase sigma factor (sigma-70 family)